MVFLRKQSTGVSPIAAAAEFTGHDLCAKRQTSSERIEDEIAQNRKRSPKNKRKTSSLCTDSTASPDVPRNGPETRDMDEKRTNNENTKPQSLSDDAVRNAPAERRSSLDSCLKTDSSFGSKTFRDLGHLKEASSTTNHIGSKLAPANTDVNKSSNRNSVARRKKENLKAQIDPLLKNHTITFVISTMMIFYINGAFWASAEHLVYGYSSILLCLVSYRFYDYFRKSWIHFCLDFCYFVNGCLTAFILSKPEREEYFFVIFSFSNGIIGVAALIYGNRLVLGSIDMMTSCYIHVLPSIVTYYLRWFPKDYAVCMHKCSQNYSYSLWFCAVPSLVFFLHSVVIYAWIYVVPESRMQQNSNYTNSFEFFLNKYHASEKLPKSLKLALYIFFTTLTVLMLSTFSILLYTFKELHASYIALVIFVCAIRGARFYTKRLTILSQTLI